MQTLAVEFSFLIIVCFIKIIVLLSRPMADCCSIGLPDVIEQHSLLLQKDGAIAAACNIVAFYLAEDWRDSETLMLYEACTCSVRRSDKAFFR